MKVDIVVGGQYGDEGKGIVAYQLALNNAYTGGIRGGGANAEHRFTDIDGHHRCFRILPSTAAIKGMRSFIGPGAVFSKKQLMEDVMYNQISLGLVRVDARATMVTSISGDALKAAASRGSTHRGIGWTRVVKTLRDPNQSVIKAQSSLHKDILLDKPLIQALNDESGYYLIEGTQGALLSIDHGRYPYTTSTNVTPTGILAECGIPTSAVRDTWAVFRTIPMRVPGASGPCDGKELTFDDVAETAGIEIPLENRLQTDSGDMERVFEWSWDEFGYACDLIDPSHIALTFTDWIEDFGRDKNSWLANLQEFLHQMNNGFGRRVNIIRYGPKLQDCALMGEGFDPDTLTLHRLGLEG